MDLALAFTAFLMGLAGAPHCAAMCGPSCAAVMGLGRSRCGQDRALVGVAWAFHLSRWASYALAGGLAAAGVGWLAWASQTVSWVRPIWTLLHVAALALGLWLAVTGRQPPFMTSIGRLRPAARSPEGSERRHLGDRGDWGGQGIGKAYVAWLPVHRIERVAFEGARAARLEQLDSGVRRQSSAPGVLAGACAGALWVVWPCGLLQSALVVSGLANTPWGGAMAMLAFALASSLGLLWMPKLWAWWRSHQHGEAAVERFERWVVRLAGTLLAVGSAWALGQDAWGRVWAYCFG